MKRFKGKIGLVISVFVLAVGLTAGASALTSSDAVSGGCDENCQSSVTEHVGGGVWTHGTNVGISTFSNYLHLSKSHGSSAQGAYSKIITVDEAAGRESKASVAYDWSNKKNHAWWHLNE